LQDIIEVKNFMENSPYSKVRQWISSAVTKASNELGYDSFGIESSVDLSKAFGDISCSIAFKFSKEYKKAANEIANELASKIKKTEYIEKITTENGFINFHLNRDIIARLLFESGNEPMDKGKGERVIIEYPSVNPNKPWHVGHLRNALLGDSISNAYGALGFNVEREDYIDDLGLQMAETTWWQINNNGKPNKKYDQWLGEEYVKANEQLDDKSTKDSINKIMALMGQNGTYESQISREIATECVKAQYETASNFSIYHDILVWESDIVRERLLEKSLAMLKKHHFVEAPKIGKYANCTVINLKAIKGLPDEFMGLKEDIKVLVRKDGTPTYLAKDIAFHMWKFGMVENTFRYSVFIEKQGNGKKLYSTGPEGTHIDFTDAKLAVNVIDTRQSHPQLVLILAFRAMERADIADNIKHLAYGEVDLESGTLSGRKGTWVGYSADDLLRETESKARQLISSRFKFDKEEEEKIIKSVALSAIKFEFLRLAPEKKIIFSWAKALNFEGNSGPYAQYMHARASRIIEEAPKELLDANIQAIPSITDTEFSLVKLLLKKENIIEKAANELRPNVITEYVSELAYAFASFYEKSPILKAETKDEKAFRIMLTLSFRKAMGNMLGLLGIAALDKM
jgi:arginyl-tRNA synthetase